MPEKNDKSINIYNILHYIKVIQERKPEELNLRNITNICNHCGLHQFNTGKPLIIDCVSKGLLTDKIHEEYRNTYHYYEITKKGIEAHENLKGFLLLWCADRVEKLTEWYDK